MKNMLLICLLTAMSTTIAAQDHLALAESSLGLSKNDLVGSLTKALGREPQKLQNSDRVSYRVGKAESQADFFIYKDSCLEVQVTYSTSAAYNRAAATIKALSHKVDGERTFYTRTSAGKPVYFSVDSSKLMITAVDHHFFSGLSYKD